MTSYIILQAGSGHLFIFVEEALLAAFCQEYLDRNEGHNHVHGRFLVASTCNGSIVGAAWSQLPRAELRSP